MSNPIVRVSRVPIWQMMTPPQLTKWQTRHLHVQEAEEAAAETEAEGRGGLRLVGEGRVVELELFKGGLEVFVIGGVGGVEAAEHHGLHFLEAGHGLFGGAFLQGDGVAHAGMAQFLDIGAEEAHFASPQFLPAP